MLLGILHLTYIRMVTFLPFYSSAFIRIEIIIILFSYGKRLAIERTQFQSGVVKILLLLDL